jgi:hypothetical protein
MYHQYCRIYLHLIKNKKMIELIPYFRWFRYFSVYFAFAYALTNTKEDDADGRLKKANHNWVVKKRINALQNNCCSTLTIRT